MGHIPSYTQRRLYTYGTIRCPRGILLHIRLWIVCQYVQIGIDRVFHAVEQVLPGFKQALGDFYRFCFRSNGWRFSNRIANSILAAEEAMLFASSNFAFCWRKSRTRTNLRHSTRTGEGIPSTNPPSTSRKANPTASTIQIYLSSA